MRRGLGSDGHRSGGPFEDGSETLSAPDAHRFQSVASLSAVQLPKHCREDPAAGSADRVPEAYPRAIHVQSLKVGIR